MRKSRGKRSMRRAKRKDSEKCRERIYLAAILSRSIFQFRNRRGKKRRRKRSVTTQMATENANKKGVKNGRE